MSRDNSPCSTFSAKAPSLPQSMVTKLVAEGSGFNPFASAIPAIRRRPAATRATTLSR